MGEVYEAWDSRLKRRVAIKVLSKESRDDSDRAVRLRREAETLASLNHSGIASIYDLVNFGDSLCLILELVEGPTLGGEEMAGCGEMRGGGGGAGWLVENWSGWERGGGV